MKKHIILASIFLMLFTNSSSGQFKLYQLDGRWWSCAEIAKGKPCRPDALSTIQFTSKEEELKKKIEELPSPPRQVTEEQLIKLMGREPTYKTELGKMLVTYEWTFLMPDGKGKEIVRIYIGYGQFSEIRWSKFDRFYLTRGYEVTNKAPK